MLQKLGFTIAKHPFVTIMLWLVAIVTVGVIAIGGVFGQSLFDRLDTSQPSVSSESSKADDVIKGSDNSETVMVLLKNTTPDNAKAIKVVAELQKNLTKEKAVTSIATPIGVPQEVLAQQKPLQALLAKSGKDSAIVVTVKQTYSDTKNATVLNHVTDELRDYIHDFDKDGIHAELTSQTLVTNQITHQASADLEKGELISLPLALIVMVLVFGGFLAAGIPLVGAIVSILGGMGALFGFSYFTKMDTTVLNVLTIIGLGVSIDYGLLMISRYREVLRSLPNRGSRTIHLAVAKTMKTAGRTVLFSGVTIAVCTSALAVFEATIMKSVAISAAAVILIAVLSSLTLLPAMFSLFRYKLIQPSVLMRTRNLGRLLRNFGDVAPRKGVFSSLAGKIQKAPAVVAVAGISLLLLLGSSIVGLHVTSYGTPYLAKSTGEIGTLNTLQKEFPAFKTYDVVTVIKGNGSYDVKTKAAMYKEFLNEHPTAESTPVYQYHNDGNYGTVSVDTKSNKEAQTLVKDLRSYVQYQDSKNEVLVTGDAARDVDFNNSLLSVAWIVVGLIILATFILLFLMTGSLFIPIKAIVLSTLSLGASIGVITWGFEGGHLAGLLNFDASQIEGISPIILVMIVVFGFGLAMDYEVFLVSRIKEEYEKTKDSRAAIRYGLQGSGRIITSAGLIIVLVFLGFTLGDLLLIKQIGVALAVAVLVDMTLVRCIIVPAVMTLFGKWVWWTPKPLRKVYDRFKIEH
jgi:uncharacterized membrane protein YdfJ with MMPL/SSD domain